MPALVSGPTGAARCIRRSQAADLSQQRSAPRTGGQGVTRRAQAMGGGVGGAFARDVGRSFSLGGRVRSKLPLRCDIAEASARMTGLEAWQLQW